LATDVSRSSAYIPHARWNFTMLALDFALFGAALSFMSWVTIFPAFLQQLGASNVQIGLIAVVTSTGFALPPLFIAPYTERLERKSPFILIWTLWERVPAGVLALLALFVSIRHPTLTLWIALLLVSVQTIIGGSLTPAWLDLIARAVHVRSRGRFFGWSSALAGALGFIGSLFSQRLLDSLGFPNGYAACFAIAFVFLMVSYLFLALNREILPGARPAVVVNRQRYSRILLEVLRSNHDFSVFLATRCLSALSGAASGFYMVFALAQIPDAAQNVGLLTSFLLASTTLSNLFWGSLADRVGHKLVLAWGQALLLFALLMVLVSQELWQVALAFVLLGGGTSALNVSAFNITLEFAPPESRPTYIGLASFASVPFLIAGPLIGGVVADHVGYRPAFGFYAIAGFLALVLLIALVRDPRAKK